jgi:hypothetical protein
MKFFSGVRDNNGKKKVSASTIYKQKMLGQKTVELTPEEKYQKMFDDRMAKMREDMANGHKNSFKLPGTKQEEKPKLSKNFIALMEELAQKKAQKEMKKAKQKEVVAKREERAQKRAKEAEAKRQADSQKKPYFFGYTDDNKSGW